MTQAFRLVFGTPAHKARFLSAIQGIGKVYEEGQLDPEYAAALFILTSATGTWHKTQSYVSRNGIDIETMLEEVDFSGGHLILVNLAGNLFNGHIHIDPLEFVRLDENNFDLALTAIKIRRYGLRLSDVKGEMQ